MKLKEINVDLVKVALKSREFGTKNSIADTTGLSVGTCKTILEELLASGEVFELEPGPSTGGRPSRRFSYNENFANVALIYARQEGEEKSLFLSVVNLYGQSIHEEYIGCSDIGPEEIDEAVKSLLERFPAIKALSIGVPGIVRSGSIDICDFNKLSHLPLQSYLEKKFRLPVSVENDVNLTALGYFQRLDTANPESLVYIYYPEDGMPGSGIVINGRVLRGRSNFAGELSFMPNWIGRDEQGEAQKNKQLFCNYIIDTVLSVNCLINPECIVLSGQWFTEDLMESIKSGAHRASPEGHSPELRFESDIHDSYLDGLKFAGMKLLSCRLEVIEK